MNTTDRKASLFRLYPSPEQQRARQEQEQERAAIAAAMAKDRARRMRWHAIGNVLLACVFLAFVVALAVATKGRAAAIPGLGLG